MKFIYVEQSKEKKPTFGEVQTNQFFVDHDGYLCQKTELHSFTVVAKPDGTPYSNWIDRDVYSSREILRIIPFVEKIVF